MAPRKRSGRGISFIFCCFRSNDHPEITYRLRNDSAFALQTMEPALPMPPVEELDVMFSELVVSDRPTLVCIAPFIYFNKKCIYYSLEITVKPDLKQNDENID